MEHVRQNIEARECALASACMVSGQDYPTAQELYILDYGYSWTEDFDLGVPWEKFMAWGRRYGLAVVYGQSMDPSAGRRDPRDLALKGRGQLVLGMRGFLDGSPIQECHAVAYEDGLVYDPNEEGPLSWAAYRALLNARWVAWWLNGQFPG